MKNTDPPLKFDLDLETEIDFPQWGFRIGVPFVTVAALAHATAQEVLPHSPHLETITAEEAVHMSKRALDSALEWSSGRRNARSITDESSATATSERQSHIERGSGTNMLFTLDITQETKKKITHHLQTFFISGRGAISHAIVSFRRWWCST